ncbi:MarR family winged helix-turn-helix transcriptional regulator, partial [Streptomyces bottropensis]|uniref:MarR family winged helix-turn-helix transcriptional regulator n=1 Tax=Streptomyces bottropensis TaxID=42235 RepID=UPI00368C0114
GGAGRADPEWARWAFFARGGGGARAPRLDVEASHVTRQVQRLERSGHLTRVADPGDRRALRVRLTPTGRQAVDRIREAGAIAMCLALADWPPDRIRQLAALVNRLVDAFLTHPVDAGQGPGAGSPASAAGDSRAVSR